MKRLFRFKYPKIAVLALSVLASYLLFASSLLAPLRHDLLLILGGQGYIGTFIAGILFAFGFTAPISIGILASVQPENIFLAALSGGF